MFFLLRIAFWLGLICVLLPGGGSSTSSPEAQINATQAVTLASAAVSDVSGFCDRQPDACKVGGRVVLAIGQKAEAGARTLYDIVTTKLHETAAPQKTTPKAVGIPVAGRDITGTLTSADVAPAWHAPVPLPRGRPPV